jgi:alpha 1,6-mannosyltransferase
VEFLDLSDTDGTDWKSSISPEPAVIVSIDVNVHSRMDWHDQWPRAVGICQWTLSGAPHHPIYLDAVRRVVNATRVVQIWDQDRTARIEQLERDHPQGWEDQVRKLQGEGKDHAMSVMEWTGPGLFSDAVLSCVIHLSITCLVVKRDDQLIRCRFLLARYNVTWHRLRALDHPLRIGDVLILPITGFSPGGEPDFGAEGPDSPQADVLHNCALSLQQLFYRGTKC